MKRAKKPNPKRTDSKSLARSIRLAVFDFDGVFTDNRVLTLQDGTEGVFCCRSDGFGIKKLQEAGIESLVISTEVNPVVGVRCRKLNLPYIQGCENKLTALKAEAQRLNITLEQVAFLGNDTNDMECLKAVGFPACVADSHPDIFKLAKYITKIKGGKGAVREFCDLLLEGENE